MFGCVGSARSAVFGYLDPAIELHVETHTYSPRLYIGLPQRVFEVMPQNDSLSQTGVGLLLVIEVNGAATKSCLLILQFCVNR